MIRTQIQLTEKQADALRDLAAREHVSVAELIRRSVDAWIRSSVERTPDERWQRALAVAGRFRSNMTDVSTNHDRYLAEAYKT